MEIVSFEIAKKLKEKGFREECLSYYTTEYTLYNNVITLTDDKYLCVSDIDYEEFLVSHNSIKYTNGNYVDAPTISQVSKWLREKYKVFILIEPDLKALSYELVFSVRVKFFIKDEEDEGFREKYLTYRRKSHEQAAIAGICWTLDNLIGVWDLLL